jgi:hypothetical protein
VFKGIAVRRNDPFPYVTGSAYSSHPPATTYFHPLILQEPLFIGDINVVKSLNAVVPTATSAASAGSEVFSYAHLVTFFVRQDYAANSTNLTSYASCSFGLTASLSYTSVSQTAGLAWNTDATGGTSLFSTTSGAGNWSSYFTGAKAIAIPANIYLTQGEYFVAHAHSSTTATSNSNITLLSVSNLHVAPQVNTVGALGFSVSNASMGPYGFSGGVASAVTTNATMPGSVVSQSVVNLWLHNFGP